MENIGDILIVSSFQYLEITAKSKGTVVMKLRCWQHGRGILIHKKLAPHWIKRWRGLKWNDNLFRRILTVALGNVHKWMLRLMLGLGEDTDTSCLTHQVLIDGPAVLHHSGCTRDISLQNFHLQRKGQSQNGNVLFVQDTIRKFACLFCSMHFMHWAEFLNNYIRFSLSLVSLGNL